MGDYPSWFLSHKKIKDQKPVYGCIVCTSTLIWVKNVCFRDFWLTLKRNDIEEGLATCHSDPHCAFLLNQTAFYWSGKNRLWNTLSIYCRNYYNHQKLLDCRQQLPGNGKLIYQNRAIARGSWCHLLNHR